MVRAFSAVTTVIFLACWCLLIVSFANAWHHYDGRERYDEDGQFLRVYSFYPTKVKITHLGLQDGTYSYKEFEDYLSGSNAEMKLTFPTYLNAGLAFAVLAWIVCTVQLVLQAIDTLGKDFIPVVGKFLGIGVFILSFISFLVVLGFKPALLKDCQKTFSDCEESAYGFYKKSWIGSTNVSRWAPSSGWNSVLIASILSFFASILNIVFFNKSAAA